MAESSNSKKKVEKKIGPIDNFTTFGGKGSADAQVGKPLHTQTSEQESQQTLEPQNTQTPEDVHADTLSRVDGHTPPRENEQDGTHVHVQALERVQPQGEYTSVDSDAQTIEITDVQAIITRPPNPEDDVLTLSRRMAQMSEQTLERENTQASQRVDVQTQKSEDVVTSKQESSRTSKRSERNPEKEAGRQTVFFDPPLLRQELQALAYLEGKDISVVASKAVRMYVDQSPLKELLPAILAIREQQAKRRDK